MINFEQTAVQDACEAHNVKRLHVFGSFASGAADNQSDVDLLVKFDREGYEGAFEQLMAFKETMETILQRPVDLVVEKPFRNQQFQEEVDRTKRLVYAA